MPRKFSIFQVVKFIMSLFDKLCYWEALQFCSSAKCSQYLTNVLNN